MCHKKIFHIPAKDAPHANIFTFAITIFTQKWIYLVIPLCLFFFFLRTSAHALRSSSTSHACNPCDTGSESSQWYLLWANGVPSNLWSAGLRCSAKGKRKGIGVCASSKMTVSSKEGSNEKLGKTPTYITVLNNVPQVMEWDWHNQERKAQSLCENEKATVSES